MHIIYIYIDTPRAVDSRVVSTNRPAFSKIQQVDYSIGKIVLASMGQRLCGGSGWWFAISGTLARALHSPPLKYWMEEIMENNMYKKCCMSQHLSGSKQRKSPTGSSSTRLCGVAAWGCYNSPKTQTCSYENGEMRCKRTSSLCCAWNPRFCVQREELFWSRDLRTMLLHPYWHPATQSQPETRFTDIAPKAAFFFFGGWWDVFSSFHWTLLRTGHLNPEMARPAEGATRLSWHHGIPVVMDIKIVYKRQYIC